VPHTPRLQEDRGHERPRRQHRSHRPSPPGDKGGHGHQSLLPHGLPEREGLRGGIDEGDRAGERRPRVRAGDEHRAIPGAEGADGEGRELEEAQERNRLRREMEAQGILDARMGREHGDRLHRGPRGCHGGEGKADGRGHRGRDLRLHRGP